MNELKKMQEGNQLPMYNSSLEPRPTTRELYFGSGVPVQLVIDRVLSNRHFVPLNAPSMMSKVDLLSYLKVLQVYRLSS